MAARQGKMQSRRPHLAMTSLDTSRRPSDIQSSQILKKSLSPQLTSLAIPIFWVLLPLLIQMPFLQFFAQNVFVAHEKIWAAEFIYPSAALWQLLCSKWNKHLLSLQQDFILAIHWATNFCFSNKFKYIKMVQIYSKRSQVFSSTFSSDTLCCSLK